jgi:flagellar basal body-associated protein FliL
VPGSPAVAQDVRARAASAASRQGIPPPLEGGRSVYAAKRSRGRMIALIAGAVIVVAVAAVVAATSLGGSSSPKQATSTVTTSASRTATKHAKHASHKPATTAPKTPAVSPAETNVAVLNATEAEGLAKRTASTLQQNGYSQANALYGKPPGSGQVTVVEYASGHQAEAEGVAHSLSVTHVLPIEAAVTALAGSANVVVIVGADKEHET